MFERRNKEGGGKTVTDGSILRDPTKKTPQKKKKKKGKKTPTDSRLRSVKCEKKEVRVLDYLGTGGGEEKLNRNK